MRVMPIVIALALAPSLALAQPSATLPRLPLELTVTTPPVSYARSIALADGIAAGLSGAFVIFGVICFSATFELFEDEKPDSHPSCPIAVGAGIGAVGTYALVPAAIHLGKGHRDRELASVGLRVGLPIAAGYLAHQLDDEAAGLGVLGGIGAAVLIDWLVLAQPKDKEAARYVTPTLMPSRGGAVMGLGGRF